MDLRSRVKTCSLSKIKIQSRNVRNAKKVENILKIIGNFIAKDIHEKLFI